MEFKKKDIVETGFSSSELYTDTRQKQINISNVDVGSIVAFEWAQKERPMVFQDIWYFQGREPVIVSRYTLQLPPNWTAKAVTFNHAEIAPAIVNNSYTWELSNLAPIARETRMPSLRQVSPWLAVSYSPPPNLQGYRAIQSWQDVSRWYTSLAGPQAELNDEIASQARQAVSAESSLLEKLRAVSRYVQKKIRYVAIEIGIGGYRPHAAGQIFRNGYGDCKDKVILMQARLKALGITSFPVLVYSGDADRVRPEFPSVR